MADEVHTTVIAGLSDIYLHVDALHMRSISFLNGSSNEEFMALLSCADQVLRSVWWVASDGLALMREVGIVNADSATTTALLPETFDIDDDGDEQRRAIASLEGVIGEVEQQISGIVQSGDPGGADVRKTEQALLMLGYLSSIGMERIEMSVHRFPSRPVSHLKPVPDQGPDVGPFIQELGQMYLDDPKRMTEEESAFISTATRPRTREIGQLLHGLGGMRTMRDVHDAVEIEQGRGAASMLRIAWGGIGDWPK